jgi:N-acylneuraminate cytidylyltransferase
MASAPQSLVVIPARGGSKAIPGKNLKMVQGLSLIARAVTAARLARSVARVVVSTDDAAIAAAAHQGGAEIVVRPAALASDEAGSEAALLHAIDTLSASGAELPEFLVFVQCTSPFVTPADIDGTIATLIRENADSAFTAIATHAFLWRQSPDGTIGINHDPRQRLRRQERSPEFFETGAVYAMRLAGFREARHRFFGKTVAFAVPHLRALEIDSPDDLAEARLIAPAVDALPGRICQPLRALVMDFDGVMTDDAVMVDEHGLEAVRCSRSDGFGLEQLKARGLQIAVISRERNPVVTARCAKLAISCIPASHDKLAALNALCAEWHIALHEVAFVGNDLPDIACIEAAGLGVAVADAHPAVRMAADLTLRHRGGQGAIRELCDALCAGQDHAIIRG